VACQYFLNDSEPCERKILVHVYKECFVASCNRNVKWILNKHGQHKEPLSLRDPWPPINYIISLWPLDNTISLNLLNSSIYVLL